MLFRIVEKTFEYTPPEEFCDLMRELFQDFTVPDGDKPDFIISSSRMERNRRLKRSRDPMALPEDIEGGALMISIIDLLRPFGNLLIHSAAVVVDGEAYAFTGPSGIGKSTQCMLWLKHFGNRAYILNGDKAFYHRENGAWEVYGSPWKGKEHIGINGHAPLRGIFYLSQASANRIRDPGCGGKAERLIRQTYLPRSQEEMDLHLRQIDEFVSEVPGYSLACTISDEAVRMAYNVINS